MVAVTVALLLVERYVVTPKEEIENVLQVIARDLESNEQETILAHISSSKPDLRSRAERALKPVVVDRVVVKRNLVVEFDSLESPQRAKASFNAVIVGSEKTGTIRNQTSPWYFIVDFVKEDSQWRVADYEKQLPTAGMRK